MSVPSCPNLFLMRRFDPRLEPKEVPNELNLMWAAGFLEGEGCFYFADRCCFVTAAQVNPEPLGKLKRWFGGSINLREPGKIGNKQIFVWLISGHRARDCMKALVEHLSEVRKEQIKNALSHGAKD